VTVITKSTTGSTKKLQPPGRYLAAAVWGLGAVFYLMGFYQRVAPAVITKELMHSFSIGAAALGHMSAFYFYSYVAMQIPTGILSDRWGPRKLLATGAMIAGVGTLIFSLSGNAALANMGRLLIGGSVAVAFVSVLKLGEAWFPPRQYALLPGLALFFGIIGAVSAGIPLRLLVDAFNWRAVMSGSGIITLILGIAIWIVVRDTPSERGFANYEHPDETSGAATDDGILSGIIKVFGYRNTLILVLVPGGVVGCVLTFSGLWGVPFLATHYHMDVTSASAITSAMMVAWAVGGPLFGMISNRWGKRKPLYIIGVFVLTCCWSIILFVSDLPIYLLIGLIVTAGFASGCMILSFAIIKESVPPILSGTAAGVVNMGVMTGPMLLQPAVGFMMDRSWQGELVSGIRIYGIEAYRAGFLLMILWVALSAVLICFVRETHCRQIVYSKTTALLKA